MYLNLYKCTQNIWYSWDKLSLCNSSVCKYKSVRSHKHMSVIISNFNNLIIGLHHYPPIRIVWARVNIDPLLTHCFFLFLSLSHSPVSLFIYLILSNDSGGRRAAGTPSTSPVSCQMTFLLPRSLDGRTALQDDILIFRTVAFQPRDLGSHAPGTLFIFLARNFQSPSWGALCLPQQLASI